MSDAAQAEIPQDTKTETAELVPKKAYEEVVQDMLKNKALAKDLTEQLLAKDRETESLKLQGMKSKEQWQKVAEIKEKEADELKKRDEIRERKTSNYIKRAEVMRQATKLGLKEEAVKYLDLMGYDDVQLETTSLNGINVIGADRYVERIKAESPFFFLDRSAPMIDASSPSVTKATQITKHDVLKLQSEGKQAEYEAALRRLRQQK